MSGGDIQTLSPGSSSGGGSGTVTSVSVVTANGVSGSVATATTTPAITLTLGAITPTTVNGNTITSGTGTLTLGASKTLTLSDSTTLATNSITFGGGEVLTLTAANAITLTTTGSTNITLPTSGTLMANPMTTGGDVIYGGASGLPTRLANGSAGQVLTSAGTTLAPTWATPASVSLVVGTTAITSGTATRLLYETSGNKVGEISGATSDGTTLTLVAPVLGAATATSINNVAITAPASSATLTIANGKTLTASNTLTLAGTDSTTMTFPSTSGNVIVAENANTFSATQTFSGLPANTTAIVVSGGSITGSSTVSPGITVAGTLNTSGIVLGAGLYIDITKTAAAATWSTLDVRVSGVTKLRHEPDFTGASGALYFGVGNGANDPYVAGYASGLFGGAGLAFGISSSAHLGVISTGIVVTGGAIGLNSSGISAPDVTFVRQAAGRVYVSDSMAGTNYRDINVRQYWCDYTNTSTVGAVTINKACGQCIVAASASSVTVTDSLCTANSQVIATVAQNDATATLKNVVASSGSFVVTLTAAATADTKVNFLVLNQ